MCAFLTIRELVFNKTRPIAQSEVSFRGLNCSDVFIAHRDRLADAPCFARRAIPANVD